MELSSQKGEEPEVNEKESTFKQRLGPLLESGKLHRIISKNPPPCLMGMKFQARTRIFFPIIRTSRSRISQQMAAEPSVNWKQLLYEHGRVGLEVSEAVGRIRVPMMMAGWSRGVKTLGRSGLGSVEVEGNGVCLEWEELVESEEGLQWGEDVAVIGELPWRSSMIVRTLTFSIATTLKRTEGTALHCAGSFKDIHHEALPQSRYS